MTMAALECPRCGYNVEAGYSNNIHEPAAQAAEYDDFPTLQAEVQRLDSLISHLKRKRASVLRKVNNLQAKTRNLPAEILSNIFQFARPVINLDTHYILLKRRGANTHHRTDDFHHTLAAVCKFWNIVAVSTPELWKSITVRVDRRWLIDSITSLLNLHFQRARNSLVSVEIDFNDVSHFWDRYRENMEARRHFRSVLKPLRRSLFIKNARMIKRLVLIEPPLRWIRFFDGHLLSECHTLTIIRPVEPKEPDLETCIDLTKLPRLQRVLLVGCQRDFSMPETVKYLHFNDVGLTIGLEAITRYSQLYELELMRCPKELVRLAIQIIGRPLDSSTFGGLAVSHTEGSLGDLVLPKLRKLSIRYTADAGLVRGEDIADMLEVLYMARRGPGYFKLVVEPKYDWYGGVTVSALRRLRRLVEDGFDLQVVIDSCMLDLA